LFGRLDGRLLSLILETGPIALPRELDDRDFEDSGSLSDLESSTPLLGSDDGRWDGPLTCSEIDEADDCADIRNWEDDLKYWPEGALMREDGASDTEEPMMFDLTGANNPDFDTLAETDGWEADGELVRDDEKIFCEILELKIGATEFGATDTKTLLEVIEELPAVEYDEMELETRMQKMREPRSKMPEVMKSWVKVTWK